MKHYLNEGKQILNKMKKTKTGLHIKTRKNRIEVYTEKELKEKAIYQRKAIIVAGVTCFILIGIFLIFTFIR